MTQASEEDKPHRDIVAFKSKDWDGEFDPFTCEIQHEGTRGFIIVLNGDYIIHEDSTIDFVWIEHGEHPVKLSPTDNFVMYN